MNLRTKVLLAVWAVLTAYIAWSMTAPDFYRDGPNAVAFTPPYHWNYPIIIFVLGGMVIALIRPWRDRHSFWGAALACCLCMALGTVLALGAMHSPPAHDSLFFAVFLIFLCLLFYTGYAFALWRAARNSEAGRIRQ